MIRASLLHSVSYSGSWGQHFLSVEEFVDKAAELGYDGVMLMAKRPHLSLLDWPRAKRDVLRKQIEDRKLCAVCIAGYTNFTADLEHADIPQREFQVRHVTELAELARDLGGSLVRVFTGYEHPGASYGVQWKLVIEALRECACRTAEFGVTIGVQNHHDLATDYASLYDLIEEIGQTNCRAMYDAWAPALQGTDLETAAKKMARMTVHTTFADYQWRPRFRYQPQYVNFERLTPAVQAVAMGEGVIDNRVFLAAMEGAGFDGTVAYEMCSPLQGGGGIENLDRCARRYLDFVGRFRR